MFVNDFVFVLVHVSDFGFCVLVYFVAYVVVYAFVPVCVHGVCFFVSASVSDGVFVFVLFMYVFMFMFMIPFLM